MSPVEVEIMVYGRAMLLLGAIGSTVGIINLLVEHCFYDWWMERCPLVARVAIYLVPTVTVVALLKGQ